MTTANKLTLLRMALIPVFLGVLYAGFPNSQYVALGVFIAASLTDLLDGYIARHYNQITDFGKFMDPLADKVLVMAAMCWFVECGRMPGWVLAVVLFREFAVSGMRLVAVEQGRVIAAGWSGKVKTAATMVCLCLMLLFPAPRLYEDSAPDFIAQISNVVIVATTLYSGAEYFIKNRDVFKNAK
ncbi:MAG: CDP-diacylglycerol--glycerol-3-phosphate 3-phosphatidyltransferase [Oscillospiraceae bacterium]|nr:CDP-diacylglycerol--glycerol-3-phosphate 3-phosphatidyltransferase [Oscillospiraceae bacterium]